MMSKKDVSPASHGHREQKTRLAGTRASHSKGAVRRRLCPCHPHTSSAPEHEWDAESHPKSTLVGQQPWGRLAGAEIVPFVGLAAARMICSHARSPASMGKEAGGRGCVSSRWKQLKVTRSPVTTN